MREVQPAPARYPLFPGPAARPELADASRSNFQKKYRNGAFFRRRRGRGSGGDRCRDLTLAHAAARCGRRHRARNAAFALRDALACAAVAAATTSDSYPATAAGVELGVHRPAGRALRRPLLCERFAPWPRRERVAAWNDGGAEDGGAEDGAARCHTERGRVRVGGVAARAAGSTYCASAASAARSALAHASPMRAHITTPPSSARSNPAARSEHERERTRRLGRAAAKEAVVGGIHYARRGRGNRRRLVLERSASPPRPHRSRAVATRRPRRPWRARNSLQLRLEQRRVAPLLRIALRWKRETAAAAACSEPSTAGARKMPRRDPPSASLGGGSTAAVAVAVRSAHARTQRRSQRRW